MAVRIRKEVGIGVRLLGKKHVHNYTTYLLLKLYFATFIIMLPRLVSLFDNAMMTETFSLKSDIIYLHHCFNTSFLFQSWQDEE